MYGAGGVIELENGVITASEKTLYVSRTRLEQHQERGSKMYSIAHSLLSLIYLGLENAVFRPGFAVADPTAENFEPDVKSTHEVKTRAQACVCSNQGKCITQ